MDSNFQVKVTADISALQASLKNVQADLDKFKTSADGAAAATRNMEANANRGRLVAFAFGQVIRDAGFFAQDFRLGILAISNNIPILIDQLVLLSGVSQAVGGAISLLGSLLTAGLTIWAYSAQGVDKFNSSLKEYQKSLTESRAAAETEIVTLKALISIAGDQTKSIGQRQDAVNKINNSYKQYNNELTVNNVNSEKNTSITDRLTKSILLQAKATAEAAYYTKLQNQLYDLQDAKLEDQVSIFQKSSIIIKESTNAVLGLASAFSSLDPTIASNSISQFLKFPDKIKTKGMENYADAFNKLSPAIDNSKKRLEDLANQITQTQTETASGSKKLSDYDSAIKSLSDSLKKIAADNSLTFSEQTSKKIDAYKSAISELATIDSRAASSKINEIRLVIAELNKEVLRAEGNKFSAKLFGIKVSEDAAEATRREKDAAEELSNEWERGLYALDPLYQVAIENTKKLAFEQKSANESVTALVRSVGNDLVNAFMVMFETGNMSFNSIGQAILGMIKRLVAAAAAAAVLSAILSTIFPKATNFGFKSVFGMISGLNLGAGVAPTSSPMTGAMTTSGINTSINSVNSSSGGGVLETRVSGNDLVILLDRASNNRNKYF
jgi:hypothetical protein